MQSAREGAKGSIPRMPPRVPSQQALAIYAEPLAAGRRVLVFADPTTGLLERLQDLGAETVVLLTADDDLDDLVGARFDLAIVTDLAAFADPAALLASLRVLLGESGAALVAATKPDPGEDSDGEPLDYYALFDLVAGEFAHVRMIAQLAFHGIALAEVGDQDESPAVTVDTQLADVDRAPQAFVALASQHGTRLDPYAIVELPAPEWHARDVRELDEVRGLLEEKRAQLDLTRSDLHETTAALEESRARLDAMRAQLDQRTEALVALRTQVARSVELERELVFRTRQLAELSSEIEATRLAAEVGRVALAQADELTRRAERAERARAQVEPELARLLEAQAAELLVFEQALRERGQTIRSLEAEVARRERLVRELVGALDEHAGVRAEERPVSLPTPAASAIPDDGASGVEAALSIENARLRQRLDALAQEVARREGEAHATSWAIVELQRKLAAATAPRPPAPHIAAQAEAPPRERDAVLDEVDALRHALTQEHEARVRAESREERAREELSRQAELLEQLGQKLAGLSAPENRNEELR
jgi:hypothetical protein